MLPMFWVRMRKARRQAKITSQLVETLHLLANALRSGFAFNQAIEAAAKQMDPPIQDELNYFLRDTSLGARPDDALAAMVVRSGSLDLEMLVTTLLVQRTTGGNLSEVLDNVAETIRETRSPPWRDQGTDGDAATDRPDPVDLSDCAGRVSLYRLRLH